MAFSISLLDLPLEYPYEDDSVNLQSIRAIALALDLRISELFRGVD